MSSLTPRIARAARSRSVVNPTIFLIAVLVVWQLIVEFGLIDSLILPPPLDVVRSFVELILDGTIVSLLWITT